MSRMDLLKKVFILKFLSRVFSTLADEYFDKAVLSGQPDNHDAGEVVDVLPFNETVNIEHLGVTIRVTFEAVETAPKADSGKLSDHGMWRDPFRPIEGV